MTPQFDPDHAVALSGAGFHPHLVKSGFIPGALDFEVHRRPSAGRWSLEAQQGDSQVDVGLTLEAGGGKLIGPIHRAFSPSGLVAALPSIIRSLDELAAADHKLRCPECNSWTVLKVGKYGPFLSCDQARKTHKSFDGVRFKDLRCRGTLPMRALHLYR